MKRIPKQLRDLINAQVAPIRDAFAQGVGSIKSSFRLNEITAMLQADNLEGAYKLIRIDPKQFAGMEKAFSDAYWNGGTAVTGKISQAALSKPVLAFDGSLPRAEAWAKNHSSELIRDVVNDQRELARFVLTEGLKKGANPEIIARDLVGRVNRISRKREGGFIGLIGRKTSGEPSLGPTGIDTIINARADLASGDPARMANYLRLKLRNRNYDDEVNAAIKNGTKLSNSAVSRISAGHEAKALGYRGNLIAQNEATIAIENGRSEAFRQMIDDGAIDKSQLQTVWRHTISKDPREDHIQMDGVSVAFGVNFSLPDGSSMSQPHDPAGGAANNINCHCWADHVIGPKPEAA